MAHPRSSNEDRISALTDEVLCHILSFLPTKYAVGTSALAKRWKFLWTSVPILEFDDSLVLYPPIDTAAQASQNRLFMRFVDRVLNLNKSQNIQKFCMKCWTILELPHLGDWICSAIERDKIEEVDLHLLLESDVLPQSLFTCEKLVVLKLSYDIDPMYLPAFFSFPNLKILHLIKLLYTDCDLVKNLLSGCPVIEELKIHRYCSSGNVRPVALCTSSLKRLTIHSDMCHGESYGEDLAHFIVIEAPNLEYLDFRGCDIMYYRINLSSLVTAKIDKIDTDYSQCCVSHIKRGVICQNVVKFFKLINVNRVWLSSHTIQILDYVGYNKMPVFQNLTHLEVAVSTVGWRSMCSLLELSPNLKVFVFEKVNLCRKLCCQCKWQAPHCVPNCFFSSLEMIEIRVFEGCTNGMELVEYFLKNAMTLKKLAICSHVLDPENRLDILNKILMLPRGSSTCQITFS